MQRMTWMMLLVLSLPASHPARRGAVDEVAQRLAECLREMRRSRRPSG
jgi:hypothetical protein